MAERPPMMPVPRQRRGPTPEQVRRRRLVALALVIVALVAAGAAIAVAVPHIRHKAAPPPTTTAPPPPKPFRIIFPEGYTRAQMAERVGAVAKIAHRKSGKHIALDAKQYLVASRTLSVPCLRPHRQTKVEGFLFPATYDFLATTTSRQLVQQQVQAFCTNWKSVNLAYAKSKNLTPYDVLTIASMIERETVAPDERPLVSAVIYNRLHQGMPLGIDATLRYGLNIPGTESIHQSQLANPTPYNTRLHTGLPPTAIANPGLASIQAAAHPAHVNYLYFVRKPDKVHNFFTASASAFQRYECEHGYGC
ncbi:MAG TPA: endolytic transglycosylase MltG [Gaiellaceae bacterium]